jgi:hypothetical protein
LISSLFLPSSRSQNPKVAHLTSQLLASSSTSSRSDPDLDALDEEELFAELEAEIENDDGPLREQGLKELQREYGRRCFTYFVSVSVSLIRITDLGTRLFFPLCCRMERLKQMREEMHGKYTELTDEKEIIRTSA